jgi:ABC-type transporter Mla MlaB component
MSDSVEPGPAVVSLVLTGALSALYAEELGRRIRDEFESGRAWLVICDVSAIGIADIATVGALARLQLLARRCGGSVRLSHPSDQLRGLLMLTGLDGIVGLPPSRPG